MKRFAFITLLLISKALIALNADIRQDFNDNKGSEKGLKSIINSNSYANNAVSTAYKGLAETMLAEYTYMPTSKLAHFNDGKRMIEKAVRMESTNAEVRYTRLMVQLNAPSFLNYNEDIDEDLKLFIERLKTDIKSAKWQEIFINNLLSSKYLELEQKNKINSLKKSI